MHNQHRTFSELKMPTWSGLISRYTSSYGKFISYHTLNPVDIPLCAGIWLVLAWCWQHRASTSLMLPAPGQYPPDATSTGPVLAWCCQHRASTERVPTQCWHITLVCLYSHFIYISKKIIHIFQHWPKHKEIPITTHWNLVLYTTLFFLAATGTWRSYLIAY